MGVLFNLLCHVVSDTTVMKLPLSLDNLLLSYSCLHFNWCHFKLLVAMIPFPIMVSCVPIGMNGLAIKLDLVGSYEHYAHALPQSRGSVYSIYLPMY